MLWVSFMDDNMWNLRITLRHESATINPVQSTNLPHNDTILDVKVEHLENLHGILAYHTFPCDWTITLGPF